MDRNRNIITEVDGRTVGFRVDNWVLKETQRKAGCKGIVELFNKIGVNDANIDLETLTLLLMEAYNEFQYFEKKEGRIKKEVLLDERGACELIDDMGGVIAALEKMTEGLQTPIPKNSKPPQKVGEMISR